MDRNDLEDRVVRLMGAVNLVLVPHSTEAGRVVGAVESPDGERHRMTLNVSVDVASSLCMDASGQHFEDLNDAARWMVGHACEVVSATTAETAEAVAA